MPSFRVAERWVRDRSKPEAVRLMAFCWALESYVWLTRQTFHATYMRLGTRIGFNWKHKPSGAQMELALDILHRERERVKIKLARFAQLRKQEKSEGRRQWDAAKYAWVYEPDFLEFPHPEGHMTNESLQDWTPLHRAVDEDIDAALQSNEPVTLETAKVLIDAGADETIQDAEGRTPRDVAAAYGEKALRLYDAVSRLDWSAEPTLREFTRHCRDILASSGYEIHLLDENQVIIAKNATGHIKPFGRVIILASQFYGWRRDPDFISRLLAVVRAGLENMESE